MREFSDADVGLAEPRRELSDAEVFGGAPAGPPKRDVGVLESAGRGFMERGAKIARTAGAITSLPFVAFDAARSAFSDKPITSAQDWAFSRFADPAARAVEHWAINPATEQQDIKGKVSGAFGGVGMDLPFMLATGGGQPVVQATTSIPAMLREALAQSSRAMTVPATVSGTDTADRLIRSGVDPITAAQAGINTGLNTTMGAMIPLNAPGNAVTRAVQGGAGGAVQGQAERVLENAILGDRYAKQQRPFDVEELAVSAVPTAVMGTAMGPRRAPSLQRQGAGERARLTRDFPRFGMEMEAGATPFDVPEAPPAARSLDPRQQVREVNEALFPVPPDAPQAPEGLKLVKPSKDSRAAVRTEPDVSEPGGRVPVAPDLEMTGTPRQPVREPGYDAQGREIPMDADAAFRVAQAQRQRKQAAVDEAGLTGVDKDLREARAGGTTTPEGTAATAPESFTFFRAKVQDGQMVEGDRVEVRGEPFTTPEVKDKKGRPVELQVVRFLDREGQPEMPVPVRDLSTRTRPANPRYAQDIEASTYAPRRGVGEGDQQPAPRKAAQRITTEPAPDFIPAERVGRRGEPAPAARRAPQTIDPAEVNADRALAAPREPVPEARRIPSDIGTPLDAPPNRQAAAPPEQPPSSAAPAPRPEPVRRKGTEFLQAIRRAGGISSAFAADVGGDSAMVLNRRLPGMFRKNGMSADALLEWAQQNGYITEADVRAADQRGVGGAQERVREMVRRAMQDEDVFRVGEEGRGLDEAQARAAEDDAYHAYRMETDPEYRAEQQANAERAAGYQGLGKDDALDVDLAQRASEKNPDAFERAAIQHEGDDAAFMDAVRRILDGRDTNEANPDAAARGRGEDAGQDAPGGGGRPEGEGGAQPLRDDAGGARDFDLERQSESDLRARAERDADQSVEDRRVADAQREAFTLSNADQGVAPPRDAESQRVPTQQEGLFGAGGEPKKSSGGGTLYGGLPLDKMAEAVQGAFGWAGREARAWVESGAKFAEAMSPVDAPRAAERIVRWLLDSSTGFVRATVRKSGSKTANWVIDQFAEKPGALGEAQAETAPSAIHAFTARETNKLTRALEGLTDSERRQVVALVRNPGGIRKGTKIGDAANSVRTQLDAALRYLRDSGVEIGEVKQGYFPREYDLDRVMRDPGGFLRAMEQAYRETGLDAKKAAEAAQEMHDRLLYGETGSVFTADKGSPRAPFLKGRSFGKQVDDAKHPLNRFLVDDPVLALTRYFERAARRAELAKRFGDKWEKWADLEKKMIAEGAGEELQRVKDYVVLAAGLKAPGVSRGALSAATWTRTWASLMFLEKATLSSLTEFIVPAIRAGNPGLIARSLKSTVGTLLKTGKGKDLVALGEDLGIISHGLMDSLQSQRFAGGEMVNETQRKILDSFFRRTGLTQWTEATRAGSLDVGRTFIRRLAKQAAEGDRLAAGHLRELGVPDARVKAFSAWLSGANDGFPTIGDLKGAEAELYRVAIRRFVKQSIMNPDSTTRPGWMSHPLGAIVGQLQSFNYAFYENVWKRNARLMGEAWRNDGGYSLSERTRMAAPLAMMPLLAGAAFAIGEARDELLGDPNRRIEEEDWQKALKAASRGAPIAPIDPLLNWLSAARYRRGAAESFAGPAVGKAARGLDAIRDYVANNSDNTNTQERRIAGDVYDLILEPTANLILTATPATALGKAMSVAGTQAAGAGGVKEAFVSGVAGPRDPRTIPAEKRKNPYTP